MARMTFLSGALLMALAVLAGAFGAHILQDTLTAERFNVYGTAVEYHFYHALGLLVIGALWIALRGRSSEALLTEKANIWIRRSVLLLWTGLLIFCGSLYLLVLTDTGWLGAVTPIGGIAFIAGWIALAYAVTTLSLLPEQS